MPVYATQDYGDGAIQRHATIRRFATRAQAEEYLLQPYIGGGWDMSTAKIGPGRFSDYWYREIYAAPRIGDPSLAPLSFRQVYVKHPGTHPGGKEWWVTPSADVLIVTDIREEGAES